MAERSAQYVVKQAQSMGDESSIDVSGISHILNGAGGVGSEGEARVPDNATYYARQTDFFSPSTPLQSSDDVTSKQHHANHGSSAYSTTSGGMFLTSGQPDGMHAMLEKPEGITNGETGSYDGSDDAAYQHSASGDTVHSDTDMNKTEGAEQTTGDGKNERPNSFRRLASFKPVSVTKNFLAKSAAGVAVNTKPSGDKSPLPTSATPVVAPVAKPRLVAKSGRDTRLVNLSTGQGVSGPDASKVWNRNQPAAPPPPKQFTDEELKQQYGIHLATRLQSDEPGKESKWADIDDDEDDWAPESTVEWMDGTKSTAVTKDGKDISIALMRAQAQADVGGSGKAGDTATQRPGSISSIGKTILRPGARTTSQTKPGLVLKSVPESLSVQENSATTNASKSPWAQLPPIDKASPVTFNLPQPPPKLSAPSPRESTIADMISVTSPAREIAADDFSRAWREGERSSRELFNSQSGRYEPVKSGRRPSRHESGFRAPAVLQRPSQQAGGSYAESSTSSQRDQGGIDSDERPSIQRRVSSGLGDRHAPGRLSEPSADVSSGSPVVPPQVLKVLSSVDSPPASHPRLVPEAHRNDGDARTISTGASLPFSSRGAKGPEGPDDLDVPQEDIRVMQQRMMRERIERNRKRKQEEEAFEEAARKERIRKKMETLGDPPSVEAPQQKALQHSELKTENTQQQRDPLESAEPEMHKSTDPGPRTDPSSLKESDPVPQPKYANLQESTTGIMAPKPNIFSRQPDIRSILETKADSTLAGDHPEHKAGIAAPPSFDKKASVTASRTPPPSDRIISNRPSATTPARSPVLGSQRLMQSLSDSQLQQVQQLPGLGRVSPADLTSQGWSSMSHNIDQSMGWAGSASLHTSNVWGPPSKDKPLGNGAFDSEFQSQSSVPRPHQPQLQSNNSHARLAPKSPITGFEGSQTMPTQHSFNRTEEGGQTQQWLQPHPSSHGPHFQARQYGLGLSDQSTQQQLSEQAAKRAWKDFSGVISRSDPRAQEGRYPQPDFQPTFKETYRQTVSGDVLGSRQVVAVSKQTHEAQAASLDSDQGVTHQVSVPVQHLPSHLPPSVAAVNNRPSRFFGPGAEKLGVALLAQPSVVDATLHLSASPPPPDSAEHPAFGSAGHPLVHLPTPPPKVKLPPALAPPSTREAISTPVPDSPHAPDRYRVGPQPLVRQVAWQDRFNGLFARPSRSTAAPTPKSAPPQTSAIVTPPALTVETSSKTAFDVSFDAATVSLPSAIEFGREQVNLAALPDTHIETKTTIEELMDEREFGDKPTVHLPKTRYDHLNMSDATPPQKAPARIVQLEDAREFRSTVGALSFDDLDIAQKVENGIRILIRLLGRDFQSKILVKKSLNPASSKSLRSLRNKKRGVSNKFNHIASSSTTFQGHATPRTDQGFPIANTLAQSGCTELRGELKDTAMSAGTKHSSPWAVTEPKSEALGLKSHEDASSYAGGYKSQRGPRNTWPKPPKGPRHEGNTTPKQNRT